VVIIRAKERTNFVMQKVTYQQLTDNSFPEEHSVEALFLELAPGGEKGNLELVIREKNSGSSSKGAQNSFMERILCHLRRRQHFLFRGHPHILKNTGTCPLKAIWVICPPRMFPNT
jgi:hypothetical protein